MSFIPSAQIDIKAKVKFTEKGDFGKKIEHEAGVIMTILPQDELDALEANFKQEQEARADYLQALQAAKANPEADKDDLKAKAKPKADNDDLKAKADALNEIAEKNLADLDAAIDSAIQGYAFEDENGEWVAIELSNDDFERLEKRSDFKQQLRGVFITEQREAFRKN